MATSFAESAQLAGFFLAHAVWTVSDASSGPLIPMAGFRMPDGGRKLMRFVSERIEQGVADARKAAELNAEGGLASVVVFDGFVTLADGVKRDALVASLVEYGPPKRTLEIVLPYRSPASAVGFAIYKPKFVGASGLEGPELNQAADDFFRGVDAHEQGSAIWNKHLDQSI